MSYPYKICNWRYLYHFMFKDYIMKILHLTQYQFLCYQNDILPIFQILVFCCMFAFKCPCKFHTFTNSLLYKLQTFSFCWMFLLHLSICFFKVSALTKPLLHWTHLCITDFIQLCLCWYKSWLWLCFTTFFTLISFKTSHSCY